MNIAEPKREGYLTRRNRRYTADEVEWMARQSGGKDPVECHFCQLLVTVVEDSVVNENHGALACRHTSYVLGCGHRYEVHADGTFSHKTRAPKGEGGPTAKRGRE